MNDLKSKVLRTLSDSSNTNLHDIERLFIEGEMAVEDRTLMIRCEPPFSDWLHHYLSKTLGNTFIVESEEQNLRDLGMGMKFEDVNEYAASKADLVVRKVNNMIKNNVECCVVSVESVDCLGMVAELKIDDDSNLPVLECFRDIGG